VTAGYSIQVINTAWLNCVDIEWYRKKLAKAKLLVTLESHYIERGFGSWFIGQLAEAHIESACCSQVIGVDQLPACGTTNEVMKYHGLTEECLFEKIVNLCNSFEIQPR